MAGEPADTAPETITRVVAGIDGSEPARHAAVWAAAEAASRGVPLTLVHAAGTADGIAPAADPDHGRRPSQSDRLIEAALAPVRDAHPHLPLDTQTSALAPLTRLTELSGPDTLLVVGTRGHGALVGLLLGSVSRALVRTTRGPLVAVRGPGTDHGGYRVVLGIADEPAPRAAHFAFDAAQRHGVPVQAVRTRTPPPAAPGIPGAIDLPVVMPAGGGIRATLPAESDAIAEEAARAARAAQDDENLVTAAIAAARARYPHVAVEVTCLEGDAATTLAATAQDATLVVLGAPHGRHHRGLPLTPGHVAGKLLAHSPAPVAVIPEADHPARRADT